MTPDQIRKLLPESDQDSEIVFIDEDKVKSEGLIETWAAQIGKFFIRAYKSLPIKKTIYVVLIALTGLEGVHLEIRKLDKQDEIVVQQQYQDTEKWTQNIVTYKTPENQNKYFSFNHPAIPSPEEETFHQLPYTVLLPISGSAGAIPNGPYQVWNPNSGVA